MPQQEQQSVLIESNDHSASCPGSLYLTHYDKRDRTVRAVKILVICWILSPLALVTLIPIVHLFLAVGFLIAGPVLAYKRLTLSLQSDRVTGACPVHQGDIVLRLAAAERLPLYKYCPQCKAPLHLIERPAA